MKILKTIETETLREMMGESEIYDEPHKIMWKLYGGAPQTLILTDMSNAGKYGKRCREITIKAAPRNPSFCLVNVLYFYKTVDNMFGELSKLAPDIKDKTVQVNDNFIILFPVRYLKAIHIARPVTASSPLEIKLLKNGLRINGEYFRTWYSTGEDIHGQPLNTIYLKDYKQMPAEVYKELSVINNTNGSTDYFETDKIRLTPESKYYKRFMELAGK
ncbi:MAG: hypothetical protein QME51_10635 [Planctomycetota bacterium]|nr:hypothetical protein [Planctomycetota bacterium]